MTDNPAHEVAARQLALKGTTLASWRADAATVAAQLPQLTEAAKAASREASAQSAKVVAYELHAGGDRPAIHAHEVASLACNRAKACGQFLRDTAPPDLAERRKEAKHELVATTTKQAKLREELPEIEAKLPPLKERAAELATAVNDNPKGGLDFQRVENQLKRDRYSSASSIAALEKEIATKRLELSQLDTKARQLADELDELDIAMLAA